MQIFAKVWCFCKRLQTAMMSGRELWDTIAMIMALNSLHQDFKIITTSLLEMNEKSINKIYNILQSEEAKNPSKWAIGDLCNLVMAFRNKKNASEKRKTTTENEYYNCHKLWHFGQDCFLPNRKLNRTTQKSQREKSRRRNPCKRRRQRKKHSRGQNKTPNRAHQTNHRSDPIPFVSEAVGIIFMVKE